MGLNTSFWEKSSYTIPGQSVITINFSTMPNYWRITNNGLYNIYLGIANIPRPTSYELKIGAGASKLYAEDKGRNEIYLYNEGMDDVNIILVSFRAEFNPLILAMQSDIEINGVAGGGGGGDFNGVITGFTSPLPTGTNTIGKVGIANSIPAGSNTIGKVELAGNTNTLLTTNNTTLEAMGVVMGAIRDMVAKISAVSYTRLRSGTATTAGVAVTASTGYVIEEIALITNDGENPLTVGVSQKDGTTETIILQAGEGMDKLKCRATAISFTGSNVAYRVGYIESEEV